MDYMEKIKKFVASKKFTLVLSFVGLYLLATGVSLGIFSYLSKDAGLSLLGGDLEDARSKISDDMPRTEECPINGDKFTKIEEDIWQKRRPVTAVIENHTDSRPPSGLSFADVVYEAVAEGGITRFLSVFYCRAAAADVKIAPVRSARVHYVNWAAEYGKYPIFMHVGGANDYSGSGDTIEEANALALLATLGWRVPRGNDFDTIYDSGFPVFWRNYERLDKEVATEHTMMASLDAAYKQAETRGFGDKHEGKAWDKTFRPWKFADGEAVSSPDATEISLGFWDDYSEYNVVWKYDSETNSYLRENNGSEHIDLATNEVLSAKNVVILFVKERGPVDRNLHMLYTTIGEGEVLIFQNGTVIEGTWEKDSRTDRTLVFDDQGKEVSFVRGNIWFEAVPSGNEVDY